MAASYLLVDGHSLIFAEPSLALLHGSNRAAARAEVVKRLLRYQDSTGVRVVLVFDGGKSRRPEQDTESGLQIFYAAAGDTADSVIERLAAKYAGDRDVTVATNDRLERDTAAGFGAATIEIEQLLDRLAAAEREFQRELGRHAPPRCR